jgi:putative FmdB family regulatory protein
MPVYEYECPDCGFEFEKQQKFTDSPVKHCPNCGRRKVYRVVSKVAVTFKGSGFYITDSKSSDAAKHTAKKADANAEKREPEKEASTATAEAAGDKAATSDTPATTDTATKADSSDKADKPDKSDKPEAKGGSAKDSKPSAKADK